MAKLSAFADEVTPDFRGQVDFLAKNNVQYIEPRFINGMNIMNLSKAQMKETRLLLRDNGIKVSAIGSPIGKIKLDEPFAQHLDRFKHSVDLADFFETRLIRIFSYYPPEGENIDNFRQEVLTRMSEKLKIIESTDFVLAHENETGIYGYSAENCLDMAKYFNSKNFGLVYDPANFVWGQKITDPMIKCWPLMKSYIVHIHIKDWKLDADTGSMPGKGDGQIPELLQELARMNYTGCLTMEPHLKVGGQFGGDTGEDLFAQAIKEVRKLALKEKLHLE